MARRECRSCYQSPCRCRQTPPEPPVGTVVVDRFGAKSKRYDDGWGEPFPGFFHTGQWIAMWWARGPLAIESTPEVSTLARVKELKAELETKGLYGYQSDQEVGRIEGRIAAYEDIIEMLEEQA